LFGVVSKFGLGKVINVFEKSLKVKTQSINALYVETCSLLDNFLFFLKEKGIDQGD